jgi:hypothetical protein
MPELASFRYTQCLAFALSSCSLVLYVSDVLALESVIWIEVGLLGVRATNEVASGKLDAGDVLHHGGMLCAVGAVSVPALRRYAFLIVHMQVGRVLFFLRLSSG